MAPPSVLTWTYRSQRQICQTLELVQQVPFSSTSTKRGKTKTQQVIGVGTARAIFLPLYKKSNFSWLASKSDTNLSWRSCRVWKWEFSEIDLLPPCCLFICFLRWHLVGFPGIKLTSGLPPVRASSVQGHENLYWLTSCLHFETIKSLDLIDVLCDQRFTKCFAFIVFNKYLTIIIDYIYYIYYN